MHYKISFYTTDRGEAPVREFLSSLSPKERAKCMRYIAALSEMGNSLPACYIKHLEHGLWELRPEYGGVEFRLFYFIMIENAFYMLHAIKKKSQKTQRKDIELALKRMQEVIDGRR